MNQVGRDKGCVRKDKFQPPKWHNFVVGKRYLGVKWMKLGLGLLERARAGHCSRGISWNERFHIKGCDRLSAIFLSCFEDLRLARSIIFCNLRKRHDFFVTYVIKNDLNRNIRDNLDKFERLARFQLHRSILNIGPCRFFDFEPTRLYCLGLSGYKPFC